MARKTTGRISPSYTEEQYNLIVMALVISPRYLKVHEVMNCLISLDIPISRTTEIVERIVGEITAWDYFGYGYEYSGRWLPVEIPSELIITHAENAHKGDFRKAFQKLRTAFIQMSGYQRELWEEYIEFLELLRDFLHGTEVSKANISALRCWKYPGTELTELLNCDLVLDARTTEFACCLPLAVRQRVASSLSIYPYGEFFSNPSEAFRKFLFAEDLGKNLARDRMLFTYDFPKDGHIGKIISQMLPDSPYATFLSVLLYLEAGQTKKAAQTARKVQKLFGVSKWFDYPLENYIYALAHYADRADPVSQRRMALLMSSPEENILINGGATWLYEQALRPTERVQASLQDVRSWCYAALPGLLVLKALHAIEKEDKLDEKLSVLIPKGSYWDLEWTAQTQPASTEVRNLEEKLALRPLLPYEKRKERWELLLDGISQICGPGAGGARAAEERVVYCLGSDGLSLVPMQQKKKKNGEWGVARALPYTKYLEGEVAFMSELDRYVARAERSRVSYYRDSTIRSIEAVEALIGCPRVFEDTRCRDSDRIEVQRGNVQFTVTRTRDGGFEMHHDLEKFKPPYQEQMVLYGNKLIRYFRLTEAQLRLVNSFSQSVQFPAAAEERLKSTLSDMTSEVEVVSDLLKDSGRYIERVSENRLVCRFIPLSDEDYRIEAVIEPLAEHPKLTFMPGSGRDLIVHKIGDEVLQITRDLKKEEQLWLDLSSKVEALDSYRSEEFSWELDTEGALRFLEIVQECDWVSLEWPEGSTLKVAQHALDFPDLSLSVAPVSRWFEVRGEVALDGGIQLRVNELLAKIRESKGQFIALGDREYVSITDSLRRKLELLDKMISTTSKDRMKMSTFNAPILDEFSSAGSRLEADKAYNDLLERVRKARNFTPKVPHGLQAELREYQTTGFEWLSRLASWGAGAILADDMGLGKTLQTLALLLARATDGPSLIVVPTSVLYNWREELQRFAPGLNQICFNEERGDEVLGALKPFDVVLVSYGVFAKNIGLLAPIAWNVLVLDEAHVIKNRDTKASKTAKQVRAQSRVLLTGTPLQNHLHEIWNLAEVANPGLLGSFEQFTERFIYPIEKDGDKEQQKLLKRLLSPFILRRTKGEVLQELPEKTELTIKVELSEEEQALYETLRQEMQAGLASGDINTMQALAGITRLRQAACHPKLIDKKLVLQSSKTAAFLELVAELVSNQHRALVFSQFTSHLELLQAELDTLRIPYLYLDGADSAHSRIKKVEEFQTGDAPLFLISLKAGGTGLNLTAADYVIHMDPWWNPAIEDQASDRSYRLGQDRPVTVYRLIAASTIEEKILELHQTKKSMADALLEGTDMSQKLGREEILQLLAGS